MPTREQAKAFFGITDDTWAAMGEKEQQSFVDEIVETPRFKREFLMEEK